MTMLRRFARPMLASVFLTAGYSSVRQPEGGVSKAKAVVAPLAAKFSFVPDDPAKAVRLNGAVQVVAGSLLTIGWFPRLASLALAGSLVPSTYAGHRYWEQEDPAERAQERIHFYKNLAMMGGLLLGVADTDGRPSARWLATHGARTVRREAKLAGKAARANASAKVARTAGKAAMAGKTTRKAAQHAA